MRRFFFWGALSVAILGSQPSSIADPPAEPPLAAAPSAPAAPLAPTGSALTATAASSTPAPAAGIDLPTHDSVSCGSTNRGALADPAHLEPKGPGYVVPETWEKRGASYGTDELVGLIRRAARTVEAQYPGSLLGVADLSKPTGGAAPGHRSHQSGRDVDLLYYARDENDQFFPPDDLMPVYTRTGKAYYSEAPTWQKNIPVRYFDLARNWALVVAVLSDPDAVVTHIFVSHRIKRWLLDYAATSHADPAMIEKAKLVLSSPKNARAHTDHMHLRIDCPRGDISRGRCRSDNAPARRKGGTWRVRLRCPRRPTTN